MRIWYFLVVVLLLGVGVGVGVFVRGGSLTGEVVKELGEYSYTRAICSDGECMDVVISCSGGNVVEIVPVFYLIEHKLFFYYSESKSEPCQPQHQKFLQFVL